VKIMPLGDSITEAEAGRQTYRYYLWHLIQGAEYSVDFVGSKHGAHEGDPANTDFDMDHEGYWGLRTDQVLRRLSEGAAAAASPDMALIHLGHNDLCQGQDVDGTVAEIGAVIDVLRAANPSVAVVLAENIPSTFPCHALMPAFVEELPALATAKSTPQSPVVLVDQRTGFDPATMTYDGEHPNEVGSSLMADRWFDALKPLLDQRAATAS
jgi:lysophospholipase L1-like esterase